MRTFAKYRPRFYIYLCSRQETTGDTRAY